MDDTITKSFECRDYKIDNWMSAIRPVRPFFDENISAHGIKPDRILAPQSDDW